jgi:hypothetical protein
VSDYDFVPAGLLELNVQVGHDVVIERTPGDDIGKGPTNERDLHPDQLQLISAAPDLGVQDERLIDFLWFDFCDKSEPDVLHAWKARNIPDLWIPTANIKKSTRSLLDEICNKRPDDTHAVIVARPSLTHQSAGRGTTTSTGYQSLSTCP